MVITVPGPDAGSRPEYLSGSPAFFVENQTIKKSTMLIISLAGYYYRQTIPV